MKYIVDCKKVIRCRFVVDADTDEQADKKLLAGQYESKVETTETQDVYQGYEYEDYKVFSGEGDETVICSIEDLCETMMIGEPVWNSNTRAWMLVVDSSLGDVKGWVDLVDHCGKIVRFEPHDVQKFPLYRMRREHLGKACDDCLYDCHVDDNCPFRKYE